MASSIFWSLISFQKAPWYCLPYYVKTKITLKKRPIIVDHITFMKIHGWFLVIVILQSKAQGWVINIDFILIFIIWNKKGTLCAIVHWPMMIILFLICFILTCNVSLFFSQNLNQWFLGILCHNFLRQSKNYINRNLRFWSTATLEVSPFMLPISSKHRKEEKYQRSDDHGELGPKSDINWPSSGKLQQSTTLSSQCERLIYPWTWRLLYFGRWNRFENRGGIVYPIMYKQK